MNKILTFTLTLALAGALLAEAQDNGTKQLNKEITLEKDFVPVEKKVTKKNTLPTVKKITPPAKTDLTFSDKVVTTDVPPSIPTMMPYGYRTAHNFSDKRGYFDFGGGTQANFAASAGYRIINTETTQLAAWLQHNSSWNGKNPSKLITDTERLKQQFNDNVFGINLHNDFKVGALDIAARGHFDSFNYYGSHNTPWADDNKQSFVEVGASAGWDGHTYLDDKLIGYHASLNFNHASYDKSIYVNNSKGAKENLFGFNVGAAYPLAGGQLGLDLKGDLQNLSPAYNLATSAVTQDITEHQSTFVLTVSPYYKWEKSYFRILAGADLLVGKLSLRNHELLVADGVIANVVKTDNKDFHIVPRFEAEAVFTDGFGAYVNIHGGKTFNSLSALASLNRYSDPNGQHGASFTPFDGELGITIGPFKGFSLKFFGGYGWTKGNLEATFNYFDGAIYPDRYNYGITNYIQVKRQGAHFGAEVAYNYRSLAGIKASFVHAPSNDDEIKNGWNKGYSLGLDGAHTVGTVDLKVNPIKRLSIDLGLDVRAGRKMLQIVGINQPVIDPDEGYQFNEGVFSYKPTDIGTLTNLRAGAAYRFDKVITLWLRADNLLNRRQDILPYMGQQRLSVMGGIALVF